MFQILRSVQKKCEIDAAIIDVELRFIESEGGFAIFIADKDTILVNLVPIASTAVDAYRQFLLVAALPVITEKLASDAMVMAYPLPHGATLADPNVDTQAVYHAIVSVILNAELPENIAAALS